MTGSSRFPLQSLLDLSQMRLDDAARRLGELVAGEQEATKRLELLMGYRCEYQARFVAAAKEGLGREAWGNFQSFLAKLDLAVTQAEQQVAASKQRTAAGQKEWLDRRGKVQAFDTLAQRHDARRQQAENRREQKIQDEHAARRKPGEE
ncbi:MAG TPA: flagellar export protein FliJ [Rhodocyclaceae bacterium]|nr:flagellar export protein FliJ [Rhodocyclaceae bacterium]